MTNPIQEFIKERQINCLFHFTRSENLTSIDRRGLLTRDILTAEGNRNFNDHYRLDRTHAVCLSIEFPNYKMFYKLRKEYPAVIWSILLINPKVLWEQNCLFCSTNAATNAAIPSSGLASLQAMYNEWPGKPRTELKIPYSYPTNPQAEVLALHGVPRTDIFGALVESQSHKQELQGLCPQLAIQEHRAYFSGRIDYNHWQQES